MRFVRLLIAAIIVLFLAMMLLSAMFPSHLRISRAVDILAPRSRVTQLLQNTSSWQQWNDFIASPPITAPTFSRQQQGVGAFFKSDQLNISITKSTADSILTDWRQANGKAFTGGFHVMELRPGTITVQWYFDFKFRWYPLEKLSSLLYEKNLGPVMESSLTNLQHAAGGEPQPQ